jgi:hypothetical protein
VPIDSTPQAPKVKRAARPAQSSRADLTAAREKGLTGIGQIGVVVCVAKGWYADAATVKDHAPNLARETAKLAEEYDEVGNVLDAIIGVGPFTAILAAGLPFVLQLLANHGRIDAEKAGIAGIEDPQDLEARMIAEVERTKLVVQLARKRERAELDAMIAELETEANDG